MPLDLGPPPVLRLVLETLGGHWGLAVLSCPKEGSCWQEGGAALTLAPAALPSTLGTDIVHRPWSSQLHNLLNSSQAELCGVCGHTLTFWSQECALWGLCLQSPQTGSQVSHSQGASSGHSCPSSPPSSTFCILWALVSLRRPSQRTERRRWEGERVLRKLGWKEDTESRTWDLGEGNGQTPLGPLQRNTEAKEHKDQAEEPELNSKATGSDGSQTWHPHGDLTSRSPPDR